MRLLVLLAFLASSLAAATYTVKAGGGGTYTTIQACATDAVAGDTCVVYAGDYTAEGPITPANSGSLIAGPIVFEANAGDGVKVSQWSIKALASYITIGGPASNQGFEITGGAYGIYFASMSHVIVQNNYIHDTTLSRCFQGESGDSITPKPSYNSFLNNDIRYCTGGTSQGMYIEGDHFLISGNTFSHVEDGIALYGAYHVVRNNHFGPVVVSEYGSQHPDALESSGRCEGLNNSPPLQRMVFENNVTQDWGTDNAHMLLLRDTEQCGMADNVIRYNVGINLGSYFDVNTSYNLRERDYNNSINTDLGHQSSYEEYGPADHDTGHYAINNIFANMTRNDAVTWCIYVDATSSITEHNNLCFNTGYSGNWKGPAYNTSSNLYDSTDKFNQDPLFVNGNSDLRLRAGSPAIGAGGPLTSVAVADTGSGTSLVVNDAGFFQDGYGITGVQADWIRVGASTTVQISSIDYGTNTITLANGISRSSGDPVYLYKNSSGTVVLSGSLPNIGAYDGAVAGTPSSISGGKSVSGGSVTRR